MDYIVNVKLTLQYVGTKFHGFQRQKKVRTVQKEVELVLSKLFGKDITITSCGRTDAGVHAMMHVVNFKIDEKLKFPIKKLARIIDAELPGDILCQKAEIVPDDFHSRFDAKRREYMFVIYNAKIMPPFYRRRAWHIKDKIKVKKLKKTLKHVLGEHDFASFCASASSYDHTIRTVTKVKVKKKKKKIFIFIEGYAFLHRMIRMIVGAAVDIVIKNEKPEKMKEILEKKDRKKNKFKTAKPDGLYLYKITY